MRKIVLLIEENFSNSRLKVENFQNFCKFSTFSLEFEKLSSINRTIFSQYVRTILVTKYHCCLAAQVLHYCTALQNRYYMNVCLQTVLPRHSKGKCFLLCGKIGPFFRLGRRNRRRMGSGDWSPPILYR